MIQSGILTTIDSTTGQSTGVPVRGAWINFVQNNVTKATVQTNIETGAYSVDVPLGKYTVKIAVGDVTGIQRAGQLFELKTGDKADVFHKWFYGETGSIDDDLLKQFKQISNDINASANRAENAEEGAKQIEVSMSENGYVTTKQVPLSYLFGSPANGKYYTVDNDPDFIGMTPENRSVAYVEIINSYHTTGIYIKLVWTYSTQSKKTYEIRKESGVWQTPIEILTDSNRMLDLRSLNTNGSVLKITNVGGVVRTDYIINSGAVRMNIDLPDGRSSRYVFPFKAGDNNVGDDPAKYGLGLTRTGHFTFPSSTHNDDRIKSLMSQANGIYRMIGNVGTAQNPAILTMHSSDSDEEISSLIAVDMYRNRVGVAFRMSKTAPVVQGDFYTTLNTTVDSNGFIKKASPIIKLFDDHIEWNQDFKEDPIFEKISPGIYKISNTHGLAREGWTYEKPRGKDGNTYFKIKVQKLDDGCVISVHDYFVDYEDVTIIDDVGNKRTVKKQIEVLSQARDIKPEERWIDLRFFEKIYDLTNEPPKINIPYHPLWGIEPYIPPVVEQIEEDIALEDQRAF